MKSILALFFAVSISAAFAADAAPEIPLWANGAPGALGNQPKDIPHLVAYPANPAKKNGASMLILPGGGYTHLAGHEGQGYAEWLAGEGITCYVLISRLSPDYHYQAMVADVTRALRMVRSFARRDGLDQARVGIIGSSAGGHLAAVLLTHFDAGAPGSADPIERESSRPDLGVLCYPVITFGEFAHVGSRTGFLGPNATPELTREYSVELQVTSKTPPTFLWSTNEDTGVPAENAMLFAAALRKAKVPFSLHIYELGAHGLGLGTPAKPAPPWAADCLYWFKERKFIP